MTVKFNTERLTKLPVSGMKRLIIKESVRGLFSYFSFDLFINAV